MRSLVKRDCAHVSPLHNTQRLTGGWIEDYTHYDSH